MGAGQSSEYSGASPEELSYVLAERFATKCFTPLELTHFKDNFYSRAAEQGGFRYWNEKILSDFLGIPDGSFAATHENPLDAGPVIFRMVSYLGAFPFQNTLAPSVLTFEAMVKVVVLLTERYGKALRRGRKDRIKLLFGSLADVGRKPIVQQDTGEGEDFPKDEETEARHLNSHVPGFTIDEPANDDYDEDEDDDLALAALESLDAIEVFKHDHRVDRTVYETSISLDTFRRLVMLLLVISPLKSLESVKTYTSELSNEKVVEIQKEADWVISAFSPEENSGGISYRAFARTISSSLPYLFDPLTPLFEHMLFSRNLNLSQKRNSNAVLEQQTSEKAQETPPPTSIMLPGSFESSILNSTLISHISFFLPASSPSIDLFRSGVRLHPVFSTAAHGSSLTSFSHNEPPEDSDSEKDLITLGAYIPHAWKSPSSHGSSSSYSSSTPLPCLFQLYPQHKVLPGNPSPSIEKQPNTPAAWFSTTSGIALGCQIPPSSRTTHTVPKPHGAGSLLIDVNLETAQFYTEPVGHEGVFLPCTTASANELSTRVEIDIYTLEIWGVVPGPENEQGSGAEDDAVKIQRAKWEFEAREAERRRNVNINTGGGDSAKESARWLLETAGIITDHGQHDG
ncbi:hypothetical protein N7533_003173 [Penicillium manginii]|uniref:uncharacterized protein n=1 Tax=Penicillium manginii TaxID=203109 RepID=UPI002548C2DD|nr:uncharacterized protein N7533_003173 [Penicillium manginii]KAJ5764492.1 hypothetical protein N7533_003173 [Penicillium manginii]